MHLQELFFVLNYIEKSILENSLPSQYQALINILNEIIQAPTPEQAVRLSEAKKNVLDVQKRLEPSSWDYARFSIFNNFGARTLLGNHAAKRLSNIFKENEANPTGAVEQIQTELNSINSLLTSVQAVKNGLSTFEDNKKEEELTEGDKLLELVFDNSVEVSTINDLEKAAKKWRIILTNYSRLNDVSSDDAKILSIQKGSPLVVILMAPIPVVISIGLVVDRILKFYEKYLTLKKLQLEIDLLELEKKEKVESQEKDTIVKDQLDSIVSAVIEKHKAFLEKAKDKEEIINAITQSTDEIYDFISGGGRIDASKGSGKESKLSIMQISNGYEKIAELSSSLHQNKLISAKKNENPKKIDEDKKPG